MDKIAVSLIGNIAHTDGTTVRARSIVKLIGSKYEICLISRAKSIDSDLLRSLNLKKNASIVVKPEGTKFWNLKLITVVLRNRFNCVYCVADMFGFVTYYLLSRLLKYKIIFEAHALAHKEIEQVSGMKAIIYLLLETFIGKNADAIIALSGVTYGFYRRLNENTSFIPVFVDIEVFKGCGKKRVNDAEKIIGVVGPFDALPNKHQIDFLYANIDKFDKRIRFEIIGECNCRVPNSKIECTTARTREDYARTLCHLDTLLVPAKIATYGPKNKILEAMACGLPVFTTNKGIVGLDFAKPGENIIVCQESELAEAINQLMFDEAYLRKVGLEARKTVEENYNGQILSKKLLRTISAVLNEG
jgi:glycosyltransferase involved in cell wall biosynthesis